VPVADHLEQYWAMDFMHDQLADGRKLQVLTVVDKWNRQGVTLEVSFELTGQSVVEALRTIGREFQLPKAIIVDHGTEFTCQVSTNGAI
jgi:putative transposase